MGRKHTGKKRELEIPKGEVNILQCNVTAWSEHARQYLLTSDFDAALISDLERDETVAAFKEARKSAWAGTGSAASTANNGQVRECSYWGAHTLVFFPNHCLFALTKRESSARTHGWRGGSFASWAWRRCCSLRTSNTLWVSQRYQCPSDARRVFSHERLKALIQLRCGFKFPARGKICLFVEAASGPESSEHRW